MEMCHSQSTQAAWSGPSSSSHRFGRMNGDPALLLKRLPLSAKSHVPLRLTSRSEIACVELMAPISSFPHSKLSSAVSKALQAELQFWPALAMIQKGCTCTRPKSHCILILHTVRNQRIFLQHNSQAPKLELSARPETKSTPREAIKDLTNAFQTLLSSTRAE